MRSLPRGRALIVEDEEAVGALISRALRGEGLESIRCSKGRDALRLAFAERPDLIVLDGHLADFSGFEVCTLLRKSEHTVSVPILFVTGTFANPRHEREARRLGATGFLRKPFTLPELTAAMRKVMRSPSEGARRNVAKVLFLDDDPDYIELLNLATRSLGYETAFARSLAEAREAARRMRPDFFILDVDLPEGSGLDFCAEIRRDPAYAGAFILVLTNMLELVKNSRAYAAGANLCLAKTKAVGYLKPTLHSLIIRQARAGSTDIPGLPPIAADPADRILRAGDEPSKKLSGREYKFMALLFGAFPGSVLKEQIQREILSASHAENFNLYLTYFIRDLKRKLPTSLSSAIECLRDRGYRIRPPTDPPPKAPPGA